MHQGGSDLVTGDQGAAGDDPQSGWDREEDDEVLLGQLQVVPTTFSDSLIVVLVKWLILMFTDSPVFYLVDISLVSPDGCIVAVVGIVVTLKCGSAALVTTVLPENI